MAKQKTARPVAVPAPIDPIAIRSAAFARRFLSAAAEGAQEPDGHLNVCLTCGAYNLMAHSQHGNCQEVDEEGMIPTLLSRSELDQLDALASSVGQLVPFVFRSAFTVGLKALAGAVAKVQAEV